MHIMVGSALSRLRF